MTETRILAYRSELLPSNPRIAHLKRFPTSSCLIAYPAAYRSLTRRGRTFDWTHSLVRGRWGVGKSLCRLHLLKVTSGL